MNDLRMITAMLVAQSYDCEELAYKQTDITFKLSPYKAAVIAQAIIDATPDEETYTKMSPELRAVIDAGTYIGD